jgi:hypothetical protein
MSKKKNRPPAHMPAAPQSPAAPVDRYGYNTAELGDFAPGDLTIVDGAGSPILWCDHLESTQQVLDIAQELANVRDANVVVVSHDFRLERLVTPQPYCVVDVTEHTDFWLRGVVYSRHALLCQAERVMREVYREYTPPYHDRRSFAVIRSGGAVGESIQGSQRILGCGWCH